MQLYTLYTRTRTRAVALVEGDVVHRHHATSSVRAPGALYHDLKHRRAISIE